MGENESVIRKVVKEELMGAIKQMKGCKAAGMNGMVVEMLKRESINITDWLLRIFNRCMESGAVPKNWKVVCIFPIHKEE